MNPANWWKALKNNIGPVTLDDAYACNLSSQEAEAGGSQVLGKFLNYFKASLGYMVRPCFKQANKVTLASREMNSTCDTNLGHNALHQ
jgi:hypothetical protein